MHYEHASVYTSMHAHPYECVVRYLYTRECPNLQLTHMQDVSCATLCAFVYVHGPDKVFPQA
jgi:hypothetical protein